MSDYLDRIGAGFIIRDQMPLTYEFIPDQLVGRDEELRSFAEFFIGIDDPRISRTGLLTGPIGSGKSALARRFANDLTAHIAKKRTILPIHINCRNNASNNQILHKILTTLDPRFPERGLGVGEHLSSLKRYFEQGGAHLLIILDEVDHLLRWDGDDLLYQLLRIDEGGDKQGTLSLILVSQYDILERIDGPVLSRLGNSNHLKLTPYDENQLFDIAKQRAELALNEASWSNDVLKLISTEAATEGDARKVIELLDSAARRAEAAGRKEIEPVDIHRANQRQPTNLQPESVDDLSSHQKLMLLAICRRLRSQFNLTSGDAKKLYRVVCEEYHVKPRSDTVAWRLIKELSAATIIHSEMHSGGRARGRTQLLSLPSIPPGTLMKRLEGQLTRELLGNSDDFAHK